MFWCVHQKQKISDLRLGQRHLSPRVSGLVVFPGAVVLALLGSFAELLMVPADVLGLFVGGSGAARATTSGETAAASRAACGERGH